MISLKNLTLNSFVVFCFATLPFVWGCGGRSINGMNENENTTHLDGSVIDAAPTDGGPQDGGPDDGTVDGHFVDAGGTTFAYVNLTHLLDEQNYGVEYLTLQAHVYENQYEPPITANPNYFETRTTPDGASCHILFSSGMDPPPDDPEQPALLNGGPITAASSEYPSAADKLMVEFMEGQYTIDYRSSGHPENPLPDWLHSGSMGFIFHADGNENLASFQREVATDSVPEITNPGPEGDTLYPDADGNFHLSWDAPGSSEIIMTLNFNMDWDNSSFICHPTEGSNEMQIPMDWINELTWGSGNMMVISQRQDTVEAWPTSVIKITGRRVVQTYVRFEIYWE